MICVGFGLTSALLCIKIFFFPFSRTDSQTPNLSQYVLLISQYILLHLHHIRKEVKGPDNRRQPVPILDAGCLQHY